MKKTAAVTALLAFWAVVYFFSAPNLNPLYAEGLAFWAFVLTVSAVVLWIALAIGSVRRAANVFAADFKEKKFRRKGNLGKKAGLFLTLIFLPWAVLILGGFFSSVLFHTDSYRDQLAQPETRQFTSDVEPLDVSQLPVVDRALAYNLADKMLGSKPALGSQVTLGEPTIQKVDGKLVWVVPLENSGFFKWLSNLSGTPGYIVVSATNPRDVTYVDKYPIKYQPNAYFLDNLYRHVRLDGGEFTGLTDYSFELDDTGRPFWVVTTYRNRAGFSLPEATGAIIVDAATGKTARYTIDDMPSWVDRVQPADFLSAQLNNRGKYIHGIFNFSNKDKFETSEGYAIVYNNGRCYFFTGLTSVGADESATGFVMIDMVTKKALLYDMSGATEYAAQQSAQGKVQHLKYTASFPLITNVDGEATYFMTLKDDAGLIKQYAFVSVRDYSTVGTGETIADALDDFRRGLRSTGGGTDISAGGAKQTLEGTVTRIAAEQQEGVTVYKFMLAEQPGILYTATYDVSPGLALTREGDHVTVTFSKTGNTVVQVDTFNNAALGLK